MGGAPATVPLALWRDCWVSQDMIDPLDSLAASVRPLVSPIIGFGSYRDNAASGGTDNGSGHVDVYATGTGWTDDERRAFVEGARERGFMAFERPQRWWSPKRQRWLTASWAHHFHLILKDSRDLSDGARTQLAQWYAGSNGLAGFTIGGVLTFDPDPSPRTFLRQTWAQYQAKEADMPLTDADVQKVVNGLLNAPVLNHDANPNDDEKPGTYSYKSYGVMANWRAADLQRSVAQLSGQLAGVVKALELLTAGRLDLAQVTAAAQAGAQAALDERIAGASVNLTVTNN